MTAWMTPPTALPARGGIKETALIDWEQGQLSLSGLVHGLRRLREHSEIIGVDMCGERAPFAMKGLIKKLTAGRLQGHTTPFSQVNHVNEQTNLAIGQARGAALRSTPTMALPGIIELK